MFDGSAIIWSGHCGQKQRPRREIDNGCAGDAYRIKFRVAEIPCGHWWPNITLPKNAAIDGVERIHVVQFGRDNDHRAAWTTLDIQRLRINGAFDRPVKVQIAR